MRNFPYHKAIALLNLYPEGTFTVLLDGEFYTLKGSVMKGFLCLNDGSPLDYFKMFE